MHGVLAMLCDLRGPLQEMKPHACCALMLVVVSTASDGQDRRDVCCARGKKSTETLIDWDTWDTKEKSGRGASAERRMAGRRKREGRRATRQEEREGEEAGRMEEGRGKCSRKAQEARKGRRGSVDKKWRRERGRGWDVGWHREAVGVPWSKTIQKRNSGGSFFSSVL